MTKELDSDDIATLKILIYKFKNYKDMQADIIRKMRKRVGMHVAEKIDDRIVESVCERLDTSDDFMQGVRADEFPEGLEEYLGNLQEEREEYEYNKLNLRPTYLDYMTGLGYSEKEVVVTYNEVKAENEVYKDQPETLEVMTRDELELAKENVRNS